MKQPVIYQLILLLLFIVSPGCRSKKTYVPVIRQKVTIRIQPFNDIPQVEVDHVEKELRKIYPLVILNKRVQLPDNALNELKYRYRADSLLHFLDSMGKPGEVIIGLTARDISTTNGNIRDWGVLGLGSCPGRSCVASSFRMLHANRVEQLFKVAIHELGHTEGLPHCPNKTCFMRDAEGGNPTDEEKDFCPKCKKYLKDRGWQLN